jgi:CubicO group peptidase (beta-lactamase class C family)
MVKTMVAMLVGIAIKEGKIRSVEDLAQDYVPEMKGSAYGQTSARAADHECGHRVLRTV